MNEYLSFVDLIVAPFLLIIFYIVAKGVYNKNKELDSCYKYFIPGLFIKVFGGIAVCLVYVYYYSGGDTLSYFHDNTCAAKLFLKDPLSTMKYTFSDMDGQLWNAFDTETDWPYFGYDIHAIYVSKITWILSFITFNSFIGQTMLLSFISFLAIWRLYKMFVNEFPELQGEFAFAILFIPSVVFWGSGLLKDTLTLGAISIFTSSVYQIIKLRSNYLFNIIYIILCSWLLIDIKPYIFFALMPGTIIWFAGYQLERFKNKLVKSAFTPFLIFLAVLTGYLFLVNIGATLGDYAVDNVLEKAAITQQELKREAYQGASFDIGKFDPTVSGIASKIPIAVVSALFRPYLWESYSPAMMISGIENFVMICFTLYLLFQLRIVNFFRLMLKNHLLFFSVSFSLFFAFSVGLTTSNFGALVRYKIPAIPFFVAGLFITNYYYKEKKREVAKEEA